MQSKHNSNILVTGANGQLGQCLKDVLSPQTLFASRQELDITNKENVLAYFKKTSPRLCINTAAYTQVDMAEEQSDQAYSINAEALKNLCLACNELNIPLIHISTDYVFDGKKDGSYSENDLVNPLGVYGKSKLAGEEIVQAMANSFLIIRTSWVYSEYGKNFVKTMLRLASQKQEIGVVDDQWGGPTYAKDLALVLKELSEKDLNGLKEVYHYSHEGKISWAQFAEEIFKQKEIKTRVLPIESKDFPSKSPRPSNSSFSKDKIKKDFGINIPDWKEGLSRCLERL
ncbi:MAG: dTDP-4-dehydrorhamnose reductase [Bacteriovoracaceae bacterium]